MAKQILYKFDGFTLHPLKQQFFHNGALVPLPTRVFDLLLAFVQNPGRDLIKEDLIQRVWKGAFVSDSNFDVTLHKVRSALEEPKRKPRYIIKTSIGYRFVGEVREVIEEEVIGQDAAVSSLGTSKPPAVSIHEDKSKDFLSSRHTVHLLVSCALYSALFAAAVPLEVAYKFDQFGQQALKIVPIVFAGVLALSFITMTVGRKITVKSPNKGLVIMVLVFIGSAGVLLAALSLFLPSIPVTESTLQSYPAQAAYLKDELYFLILAIFFLVFPFHFTIAIQQEIKNGGQDLIPNMFDGTNLIAAPMGTIYPRIWALAGLLLVFLITSVAMTSRLLDHLRPGPHQNLFVQLVYLRGVLYFGLGIECLIWYRNALNEIRKSVVLKLKK